MSVEKQAKIQVGIDGTDQVVNAAGRIKTSFTQIGQTLQGVQGTIGQIGANFQRLVNDATNAATNMQAINFGKAAESAKVFEDQVTRLALRTGQNVELLKGQFVALSTKISTTAPAIASVAQQLNKLGVGPKESIQAIEALGAEALDTGRSLEDMVPVGGLFKSMGLDDAAKGLEKIRRIAYDVGTVGGRVALQDTLTSLTPQISQFSVRTDEARNRLVAFVAELGKGKTEGKATQVAGAALGYVQSNALNISRYLGYQTPEKVFEDPAAALLALTSKIKQRGRAGAYRTLLNETGNRELTESLLQLTEGAVNKTAAGAQSTALPQIDLNTATPGDVQELVRRSNENAAAAGLTLVGPSGPKPGDIFKQTRSGRRTRADVERQGVDLAVGDATLTVRDQYEGAFAGKPGTRAALETGVSLLPENAQSAVKAGAAGIAALSLLGQQQAPSSKEDRLIAVMQRIADQNKDLPKAIGSEVGNANRKLFPPPDANAASVIERKTPSN